MLRNEIEIGIENKHVSATHSPTHSSFIAATGVKKQTGRVTLEHPPGNGTYPKDTLRIP